MRLCENDKFRRWHSPANNLYRQVPLEIREGTAIFAMDRLLSFSIKILL